MDDNYIIIRGSVQLLYDKEADLLRMGKSKSTSVSDRLKSISLASGSVFDDDDTVDSSKFMVLDTFTPGQMVGHLSYLTKEQVPGVFARCTSLVHALKVDKKQMD